MATNITYNGVTIRDVLTEDIDYSNENDKTGVDPIFTRVKLSFHCVLHDLPQATLGVSHDDNIAANLNSVVRKLMEPRKRFTMTIGGRTLFDVQPAHSKLEGPLNGRDVNNGPKPSVKVLKIIGDRSSRVQFSIELAIPNCGSTGAGYLNLRYWIADDIDGNWRTTRFYRGRLRVASKAVTPHAFRNVVMPSLVAGFRRDAISLRESDDGLELDFEIRDIEQYASAPFPATKWRGNHMVVSPYDGSALCESEVRVELEGPNSVHKTRLIALAANIIEKKLHYLSRRFAREGEHRILPIYIAFNEDLAENKIDAVARIRHTGDNYAFAVELASLGNFLPPDVNAATGPGGQFVYYDPYKSPTPVPTASLAGIFLSLVQTPCAPAQMPQVQTGQLQHPSYGGQALGPAISVTYGPLPPWPANQSQSHKKAIYTRYSAKSSVSVRGGQIALPVAATVRKGITAQRTVALVQLHQGVAHRVVEVDAERVGEWPQLPKPIDYTDENGIEHTVLDHDIDPEAPTLAGDAVTNMFRASMRIEYAMSRPPRAGESLPVGNLPYRTPDTGASPTNKIPYPYFEDPKGIVAA